MFYRIFSKILFMLPPELAHHLTLFTLKLLNSVHLLPNRQIHAPCHVFGVDFANPVGLAAGLDKNGDYIDALGKLGFGFIEVGTVTPKPQAGNPKPRIFRLTKHQAIINRMGFNNKGVDHLIKQVQQSRYEGIIGINIGKNASTPLEKALDDYILCLQKVYPHADYVVVNLSSPNTPGLRELQHGEYLQNLLRNLKKQQKLLEGIHGVHVPLLVKVAPDLTQEEITEIADALLKHDIDGLIVSNTTMSREEISGSQHEAEQGGLSGQPLTERALLVQQRFGQILQDQVPIIGVGGIMGAEDAKRKQQAGASLFQLYTGLIYRGPGLVDEVARAVDLA